MELIEILDDGAIIFEETKNDGVIGRLKFPFIVADVENANKRAYSSEIVKREIGRFNERLRTSNIAGQINHPPHGSNTELEKVSHVITDLSFDEKTKRGIAVSSILNTAKGRDLKVLLDNDIPFGASVRGCGKVNSQGQVEDDYQLLSIDLVSAPSFGDDTMISKENLIESGNRFFESKILTEDQQRALYEFDINAGMRIISFNEWREAFNRKTDSAIEDRYSAAREAGYRGTLDDYRKSLKRS